MHICAYTLSYPINGSLLFISTLISELLFTWLIHTATMQPFYILLLFISAASTQPYLWLMDDLDLYAQPHSWVYKSLIVCTLDLSLFFNDLDFSLNIGSIHKINSLNTRNSETFELAHLFLSQDNWRCNRFPFWWIFFLVVLTHWLWYCTVLLYS